MECVVSLCQTPADANAARQNWGPQGWHEVASVAGQTFTQVTAEGWMNQTQQSPIAVMAPGEVLLFVSP